MIRAIMCATSRRTCRVTEAFAVFSQASSIIDIYRRLLAQGLLLLGLAYAGTCAAEPAPNAPKPVAPPPTVIEPQRAAQVSPVEPTDETIGIASQALLNEYWLPRSQFSARQLLTLPRWCDGTYRDVRRSVAEDVNAATLPIQLEADNASYFVDDRLEVSGDVVIERGNRTLRTDSAVLFEQTEEAQLSGQVRVEEPGLVLIGSSAELDLAKQAADFTNVTYLLTQSGYRGEAGAISQSEEGDLHIDYAGVTRCDPGSNTWRVTGRSIDIKEGSIFATARNAVVRIKDVPVFYVPWLRFPISDERQSGWLFPSVGFSDDAGLDLAVPYYFNVAKNFDATLTPRVLTKRGFSIAGEARHLSRYDSTSIGAAFLPNDNIFNGVLDRDDFEDLAVPGDFNEADRWLFSVQHEGGIGNLETEIDYTAVSDGDYFRDLGSGFASSSLGEIERRGEVRYQVGGFAARLFAQRFQRLDEIPTEAYQRLPQLDLTYGGKLIGELQVNVLAQAVSFDRENDDLFGLAAIVGERYHLQPELRLPLDWAGGFIEAAGGLRYTKYDLRDTPTGNDSSPDRALGFATLDGGLFFERELNLFGVQLLQTLEPRLFYLYQGEEDQSDLPLFDATGLTFNYEQLFRVNRFSGLDRIGDCLLYTSPSPRDKRQSRMPSSA